MELVDRRTRHGKVSDLLAALSDDALATLLQPDDTDRERRRLTPVEIDGVPVFAKRVPLTDLELAHPRSTANLFDLPMFCHFFFGVPTFTRFGFGGPAMNGWRELAANLIITKGVLAGETEAFPLLFHWRVLPVKPPITGGCTDVEAAVTELDGSSAARHRFEALRAASHSLVLFSEHLPHTVTDWLDDEPERKADMFEEQLFQAMAFLRSRELLHLDGQVANMRSDGERLFLIDFGLATSPLFEVTPAEREFIDGIVTHDADYASLKLVNWVASALCGVPDPKVPTATGELPDWRIRANFLSRCAAGDIPGGLPATAARILTRHSSTAHRTFRFYRRLCNEDIHTPYPVSSET